MLVLESRRLQFYCLANELQLYMYKTWLDEIHMRLMGSTFLQFVFVSTMFNEVVYLT